MISVDLMAWLDAVPNSQQLKYELDTLRAIRQWAIREVVGFDVDDVVEIVLAPNTDNGWRPYREALHVGALADVRDVNFNRSGGHWYADIVLHREWDVDDSNGPASVVRRWHGPADETPEGMEQPSPWVRENHPAGRKHTFAMPVRYLARHDRAQGPDIIAGEEEAM